MIELSAEADETGTPSMKVAVSVESVVDGVKPRSEICWKERSLRPELLPVTLMPGVASIRSVSEMIPRWPISSAGIAAIAIGVVSNVSSRLRAVTTMSPITGASSAFGLDWAIAGAQWRNEHAIATMEIGMPLRNL